MYAMCNLHDVTWGTKGDNGAAKDLGGAKKVKGEDGKEDTMAAMNTLFETLFTLCRTMVGLHDSYFPVSV